MIVKVNLTALGYIFYSLLITYEFVQSLNCDDFKIDIYT